MSVPSRPWVIFLGSLHRDQQKQEGDEDEDDANIDQYRAQCRNGGRNAEPTDTAKNCFSSCSSHDILSIRRGSLQDIMSDGDQNGFQLTARTFFE